MNAVVSLSHFCETHGPTILLSTQAFHFVGGFRGGNLESTGSQFFEYIERFKDTIEGTTPNVNNVTCEACESISGYITNDYQNKISFLSTRLATDSNVSYLLKQAAVRSLSCEVIPKKEGKVYFGDSIRGHVLSTTFFVKDAQARGFHRWYSIIVFMKDKHFLLNSWPFFQEHINQIIAKLQNKAAEVYSNEQNVCSQRALRLSFSDQKHSVARSLMKLTSSTNIFAELHLWFTWLLSMGGRRLEELIPTQLLESKKQIQSAEGATLQQEIENKKMFNEEAVSHLRRLRRILGAHNFQRFLYSALIGRQVIVRGSKHIVQNIINLLKLFLPAEKFRCQEFSKIYKTPEVCNIIGLDLCAAVPVVSNSIMRLDIVSPQEIEGTTSSNSNFLYENCHFLVKNDGELPEKLPTFLLKLDRDLSEESLTDRVVWLNILSLKEKWFHLAEIIRAAKKYQKQLQLMSLLRLLGVQEQDEKLVEFWTS